MSNSTDGSVNGKKLRAHRATSRRPKIAPRSSSIVPRRSASVMPRRRRALRPGGTSACASASSGVAAVDAAERDEVDRRLLRLHRPDLARARCACAAPSRRRGRRCLRGIAGRDAPRAELSASKLCQTVSTSRPSYDLVPEPEEDVLDLAADLGDQVQAAAPEGLAGERGRSSRPRCSRGGRARALTLALSASSIAARAAFSAIPVSRSRTSRSASFSSLLRPRIADAHLLELVGVRRPRRSRSSASFSSAVASIGRR